ncbi:MAG TPA: class I SAM-dependent methyltransferase [Stackebrandtia sp.]|jgi:SAM-dependent methyltransferase|uniref:class I SAM-dependent methyltransferase n=1 Tax=Stackebrandtia sp. TaxID=2023065 RepID=UPI002D4D1A45|nr:class I SAM-dependent methyltransferase [Stackebrandtia sp.]HZE37733.1 class I SAM-dependent methyltransferase [Stackebrandtia sp.]
MSTLTPSYARDWLDRWDRQQEGYLPEREDRFTAIADAVEAGAGRPDPLVIDLGCGPGSLSTRLLDRLPKATVVAVDADPLLLALGKAAHGHRDGLRFVRANLSDADWVGRLKLDRPADAAVSTTALHWLSGEDLRVMYRDLATVLDTGGLLINGDHFFVDETPTLKTIEAGLVQSAKDRAFGGNPPEAWGDWWEAVAADSALSGLYLERDIASHHGSPSGLLSVHVDALRDAGFGEVGTIWQLGSDRILCGVRS